MSLQTKICTECGNTKSLIQTMISRMLICKTCKTREFLSIDGKSLGVIPL